MNNQWIAAEIDRMQVRFAELRARAHALDPGCAALVEATLRDAAHALDELVAAYEDLERVNADLLQTHLIADLEHRRCQDLFENAPLGYLILDRVGKVQACNATACQLLHTPREVLVGQSLLGMLPEGDQRRVRSYLRRRQKGGALEPVDLHLKLSHPAAAGVGLRLTGPADPHRQLSEVWVSIYDPSVWGLGRSIVVNDGVAP